MFVGVTEGRRNQARDGSCPGGYGPYPGGITYGGVPKEKEHQLEDKWGSKGGNGGGNWSEMDSQ